MKKLHVFLKVFIFVQLGACVGRVLVDYIDYVQHPLLYATWSAPWYTQSLITVALTAITVTITAVVYFAVSRVIKKREQENLEK